MEVFFPCRFFFFFSLSDYTHYSSGKTQIEVHLHELAPGKWLDRKAWICMRTAAEWRWCNRRRAAVTLLCTTPGSLLVCSGLFPFKRVDLSPVHEVWAWPLKRVSGRGSMLAERWWSKRLLWVATSCTVGCSCQQLEAKIQTVHWSFSTTPLWFGLTRSITTNFDSLSLSSAWSSFIGVWRIWVLSW